MKSPSRAKAVKDKCLECSGFSPLEVTLCPVVTCPLWKWRTGNDTSRTYLRRISRAIRIHPDIMNIWMENGMSEEDVKKYHGLSAISEQK